MDSKPVAIVTAASRGIGLACAKELAARDYQLVLMSASEAILDVAEELGAVYLQGSVTEPGDLDSLVDLGLSSHQRIDVVVNNTGHPPRGELLEFTDQQWHESLDLVLLNVIRMSKLVTPHFIERRAGAIINISTLGAIEPSLSFPISSALRGALSNFTKLYARRYAKHNIRMNNVLPGFVDSYPVDDGTLSEIPMGRPAQTQEIASVVGFLAGDASSYITGQNIQVDGGMSYSI